MIIMVIVSIKTAIIGENFNIVIMLSVDDEGFPTLGEVTYI